MKHVLNIVHFKQQLDSVRRSEDHESLFQITAIRSNVDFVWYKLLSHLIYFYWFGFSNIFVVRSIPTLSQTRKHTHIHAYINRVIHIKQ